MVLRCLYSKCMYHSVLSRCLRLISEVESGITHVMEVYGPIAVVTVVMMVEANFSMPMRISATYFVTPMCSRCIA
jgi:hypothetical protein